MSEPNLGMIIRWGLLYGLFMTITGWLGNNILLAEDWDRAAELSANLVVLPYPRIVREIVSLVFDFVHMVAMFWIFSRFKDKSLYSSLKLTVTFYIVTLVVTYLAIVNSKLLPWEVALKTTLLGLFTALPAVWVMYWVFRDKTDSRAKGLTG